MQIRNGTVVLQFDDDETGAFERDMIMLQGNVHFLTFVPGMLGTLRGERVARISPIVQREAKDV
jgi:hypothetical protein